MSCKCGEQEVNTVLVFSRLHNCVSLAGKLYARVVHVLYLVTCVMCDTAKSLEFWKGVLNLVTAYMMTSSLADFHLGSTPQSL